MDVTAAHLQTLTREIEVVVTAPYTVLLKPLSLILARTNDCLLDAWTLIKECQVPALVARVLGSLNQDEAALSILLELVKSERLGDELVKQDVGVLQNLFSQTDEPKVRAACIALCGKPFPEAFTLTTEYFQFISNILANAHGEPEDVWAKRTCLLLNSARLDGIATIDDDALRKCVSLWNQSSRSANNATFIRFASIGASLHRNSKGVECVPGHEVEVLSGSNAFSAWTAKCSSLFAFPKVSKYVRSVLLRALYFVSNKATMPIEELEELLDAVQQVLLTIELCDLQAAMQDKETTQVLGKLVQKVGQTAQPLTVRLCVCGIILASDPEAQFWEPEVVLTVLTEFMCFQLEPSNALNRVLSNLKFQRSHQNLFQDILRRCSSRSHVLQEVIQQMISHCRPYGLASINIVCRAQSASMFVEAMTQICCTPRSKSIVIDDIASAQLPEWWDWEFGTITGQTTCRTIEICPHGNERCRQRLARGISNTILASTCLSGRQLEPEKFTRLKNVIERHESQIWCQWRLLHQAPSVQVGERTASPRPSSFQCPSTPDFPMDVMLSSVSDHTSRILRAYINEVCHDLQRRCQDVEAPLRAEQVKCHTLARELSEIRASKDIMAADHQARSLSLQNCIDLAYQEIEVLTQQQTKAEDQITVIRDQRESEEQMALALQTTNTELKEQLSTLRRELEQQEMRNKMSADECYTLKSANQALQQQIEEAAEKEQRLLCVLRGSSV